MRFRSLVFVAQAVYFNLTKYNNEHNLTSLTTFNFSIGLCVNLTTKNKKKRSVLANLVPLVNILHVKGLHFVCKTACGHDSGTRSSSVKVELGWSAHEDIFKIVQSNNWTRYKNRVRFSA